ncbi:unnamed protein product [Cladocopium goreaui]|uniref:Uncharacterized protein n=1 Tax=Cladocopium goreaui TaxID=2562237 RepID=A0A9P1C161_9DINO|nr:unnamed protein product [Cladocopium goreaui]
MFKQILAQAGQTWNEGIDGLIQDFNGGNSSDHKKISPLEAAVIKMFPTLLPETQELITYHWGNFQAKQSGLTLTMLGTDLLRNGSKPRAADDALWKTIFAPNEHKRHWWIARRVRFFLHKLSEAKRLRKKVNLVSGIQQLRDPRPDHEGSEGNTRQKRKLDSVEEAPQGNKLLKLEHHGKGHAIFDVDGNVWFQAKDNADAALDHDGPPIALVYGNFKIQQEAEKLLETQKDDVMMIGFEDDEGKGVFRMQQEPQGTLCSLRDFLLKLEKDGSDVTTLDLACHKIEPQVNKDEAGDVQSRTFKVTKTGPCVFVPAETPRKIASAKPPTWEDAGSLVLASTSKTRSTFGPGYTDKTCVLQVMPRWLVSNNAQSFSLTPEKPGLFVSEDSVVPAGKISKLV